MNEKQIKQAHKTLATLKKTEVSLLKTETANCDMLADVNRMALEGNRNCQSVIESWLRMIARNAA